MEVIFSDNKIYLFTEYQLIRIPYFETLINSSTWLENKSNKITINHNSIGFDFIHIFATMDEIDILDPGDNYLFVMKQCDYFCYNKLKILLDYKYGFRKIVSDINNNIGKEMMTKLKYLGAFRISSQNINNNGISSITPIFEHEFYTNDIEINEIFIKRYKSKMMDYYSDLIKKIYSPYTESAHFKENLKIDCNNYQITVGSCSSNNLSILSDKYFYKITNDILVYEKQYKKLEVYEKIKL